MMLAMEIRPSLKFVTLGYLLCLLAEVAIGVIVYSYVADQRENTILALSVIPLVLVLFVVVRHIQRRATKITVLTDRLRYESGFFSKTTRTVELSKVQDVSVNQTLAQRMVNVGDISLETAGGSSRVVMSAIDSPQEAADHILELARSASKQT
jgi:membrane protein YdbS with pleckstrin-like domain